MIVSIFSHLSRTINHREIGYFRDKANRKYQACVAGSKTDVDQLLVNYRRFERFGKEAGIIPQEKYFQLVNKAAEAMKVAASIYNSPTLKWKSEIFIVNAIISWTYLMHAYYQMKDIDYVYKKDGIIQTVEGRPKLWDLSKCLDAHECILGKLEKENLDILITVRNEIEHKMTDNIDKYMEGLFQSCALNFNNVMCAWYGKEFSIAEDLSFAIQFAEISLQSNRQIIGLKGLPDVIKIVNKLISEKLTDEECNDPRFAFNVYVVPRTTNNKNKANQSVIFAPTGSEIEMAIRQVELPKYTAKQIVEKMRDEGHKDFSTHGKDGFVSFWKSINAKKPGRGLGIQLSTQWYWYDRMVDEVRKHLIAQSKAPKKAA